MMPGMQFETSLAEAAVILLKILGVMVAIGLVAGIVTLPLFLTTLAYKLVWFWAAEEKDSRGWRKLPAVVIWLLFPLLSLSATVIAFGYCGVFDMFQSNPPGKKGSSQLFFEARYEGFTGKIGESLIPRLPAAIPLKADQCPNEARSILKKLAELEAEISQVGADTTLLGENRVEDLTKDNREILKAKQAELAAKQKSLEGTRKAVEARVMGLIFASFSGNVVDEPGDVKAEDLSQDERRAFANLIEDRVEQSKSMQTQVTGLIRTFGLFNLLLFGPMPFVVFAITLVAGRRGPVMILRSLRRNLLRTSLTYLAVFVFVWVIIGVWSVLDFLSILMADKDANFKAIITERYQIPSQMKPSHIDALKSVIDEMPADLRPTKGEEDMMSWAFVGGTLDPKNKTFQNSIFFFALEPDRVLKMMPGLEDLTGDQQTRLIAATKKMQENPRAVVIGHDKLVSMKKRVGDRMKITSLNYKDIEFEFEIIEEFPSGTRWEQSAVMSKQYLTNSLDAYAGTKGQQHPLADKCTNLIWVRLPNKQAFEALAERVENSPKFTPPVKIEIESSAYANFLSSFKDLLWFMRWVLAPGLLIVTTLVISLVVSIGVRERRGEMAVLKVLGFRPWMVLALVLGEALLIGMVSGFLASAAAYSLVNAAGGIPLPIGFFGKFFIPDNALWWGPAVGAISATVGTIVPAISAQRIKVSQVFSRMA
jgi:putative ABC transport system permease protein